MPHRHIHLHTYGSGGTRALSGHDEFDPNEPRNAVGEWTTGGNVSKSESTAQPAASPAVSEIPDPGPKQEARMERLRAVGRRFDEMWETLENPRRYALVAQNLVKQIRTLREAAKKGEDIAIELRRLKPITETSTDVTKLANLYLTLAKETYIKGYGTSYHDSALQYAITMKFLSLRK